MIPVGIFLILHGVGILEENYEKLTGVQLLGDTAHFLSQPGIYGWGIWLGIAMIVSAIGLLLKRRFAIFSTMVISIYFMMYMLTWMIALFLRRSGVPVPIYLILGVIAWIYGLIFRTVRAEWLKGREV